MFYNTIHCDSISGMDATMGLGSFELLSMTCPGRCVDKTAGIDEWFVVFNWAAVNLAKHWVSNVAKDS